MAVSALTYVMLLMGMLVMVLVFTIIETGFVISISGRVQNTGFVTPNRPLSPPSCSFGEARKVEAYRFKELTAYTAEVQPVPCHGNNGDETLYPDTRAGSYSKGLVHDDLGQPTPASYQSMLNAVNSGLPADFDVIQLGCLATVGWRRLTDPQSGLAFQLEGGDAQSYYIPPPPTLTSNAEGAELVENYWMALTRDVRFDQYGSDVITGEAVSELNMMTDWPGPTPVTAQNLFRSGAPGVNVGPYISQFFYLPCHMGPNAIDQKISVYTPDVDFMTNWTAYLNISNGCPPPAPNTFVPGLTRFMITGRDLARWVQMDVLFQAYIQAGMILLGMGAPLKSTIPYYANPTQIGFGTFGDPHILASVVEVAQYALRNVWFQKWFVHRRLRPEEAGARVDRTKVGATSYSLAAQLLSSNAVTATFTKWDSYLLPQAYAEGCPTHPSYGAGHATVAGACATMLKFWFDETWVLPSPVAPSADGSTLDSISDTLTVGGEINKLASNIAFGRNIAGVHWRTDAQESLLLGQQITVTFLQQQKAQYNEIVQPWTATGFDGELLIGDNPIYGAIVVVRDDWARLPVTLTTTAPYVSFYAFCVISNRSSNGANPTLDGVRRKESVLYIEEWLNSAAKMGIRPGRIYHQVDKDADAWNKNACLHAIKADNVPVTHLMLLEPGMTVNVDASHKRELRTLPSSSLQTSALWTVDTTTGERVPLIIPAKARCGFLGVVHERLVCVDNDNAYTLLVPQLRQGDASTRLEIEAASELDLEAPRVEWNAVTVTRSPHILEPDHTRNAQLLLEDVARDPRNARSWFFLGIAMEALGRWDDAFNSYKESVKLFKASARGAWNRKDATVVLPEETWYSAYHMALCKLNSPVNATTTSPTGTIDRAAVYFMEAYDLDPRQREPLYALARGYRLAGKHSLCKVFGLHGLTLPVPSPVPKWIEVHVYEWSLVDEVALCLSQLGDNAKASEMLGAVLKQTAASSIHSTLDEENRERLENNLAWMKARMQRG